jgi:hypothetical protein
VSANPHTPQTDDDHKTYVLSAGKRKPASGVKSVPAAPVPEVGPAVAGVSRCDSLPDFQFLACVGRTDTTESWMVRTPENRLRQIKFVHGFRDAEAQARWERLITFQAGSHPALLPVDVIQSDPGRAVLLSDLVERSLADRFEQCRRQKLPGIPRAELLGLLQPVADVLDTLFRMFRVQHLNLSPKTLLLDDGRLMMADVGLLQVTDRMEGSAPSRSVLRCYAGHAAPEWVTKHQAAPTSDQYSLALIFAEMLTGTHPLGHLSRERATRNRERWRPSLELLPKADHEVLSRALHSDPFRRYPTCAALMAALRESGKRIEVEAKKPVGPLPAVIFASGEVPAVEIAPPDVSLDRVVTGLVQQAAGRVVVQEFRHIRYLLRPGELLQHRCAARMLPGVATIKLDGFCVQWRARPVYHDDRSTVLRIPLPRDVWQFCLGREVALEVEVQMFRPPHAQARWTEIGISMRPLGCAPRQAVEVLDGVAPVVLESLRHYLQVTPEMRTEERLTCVQPIRVAPVFAGQKLGGPIECQGKDISLHGIGFYLPQQPPSPQIYIQVPTAQQIAELALLAKVVRVKPFAEGWYEVGAQFVPSAGQK